MRASVLIALTACGTNPAPQEPVVTAADAALKPTPFPYRENNKLMGDLVVRGAYAGFEL